MSVPSSMPSFAVPSSSLLDPKEIALQISLLPPGSAEQLLAIEAYRLLYGIGQNSLASTLAFDEEKAAYYKANPSIWVKEVLGQFVWSKQIEIMESVRDHRITAVQSGHNVGKSFVSAIIVAWWLSVHRPGTARVITTAPTDNQVKAILWHEISRAFSSGKLPGRLNQKEWYMNVPDLDGEGVHEELVAFGRKPKDHNPDGFHGFHERYILVLFDEAAGIPKVLYGAADSLISNNDSRWLNIGNPNDNVSEFAKKCRPGSGANVIKISAYDSPNFTGEYVPEEVGHRLVGRLWVEEKKKTWGEDNPMFIAKVLGEFPQNNTETLIPIGWIRSAQEREFEEELPSELGVDVGGGGSGKTTIYLRQGKKVRKIHKSSNPDTMQTLEVIIRLIEETGATLAKVDNIGIGHGMLNRAREIASDQSIMDRDPDYAKRAAKVVPVDVRKQARDKKQYINRRAELAMMVRGMFEAENIDIDEDDDDLAGQLSDIRYKTVTGRFQIESKEEMMKRGKPSPDDFDALVLSFADPDLMEVELELTW